MNTGTYEPDNLVAGDTQLVTDSVTIADGVNIVKGEVLGKITSTGEYQPAKAGAADGSDTPNAIAAEDVDASTGAVNNSAIWIKGEFNGSALTLDSSITLDEAKTALREVGIYIK